MSLLALALGIDTLIKGGIAVNDIDADSIHDVLMFNISFDGASGFIDYFEGMPDYGYYAMGDREVGHHYKVLNFNKEAFLQDPTEGFVPVGVWSVEDFIVFNDTAWSQVEQMRTGEGM